MLDGRALACSLLVLITSVTGCKRDLGECNLDGQTPDGRPIEGPAAFDIAYRLADGLPMYEGQALVQTTCGAGQFCHSPAAVGADRIGVPAGLNFDVDLACTDETQDPTCAKPIAAPTRPRIRPAPSRSTVAKAVRPIARIARGSRASTTIRTRSTAGPRG
jgi:hypothetical protein